MLELLRSYWQLSRPRIVAMVLLTLVVAALVAGPRPSLLLLVHALLGNALVIVGAVAMNQRFERRTDMLMSRTARRPLPAGRLTPAQVTAFGLTTSLAGVAYLVWLVNWPTVIAAVASWIIYVWIYTPLKLFSTWQTPIGAVAGAMPVILGAAAVGVPWSLSSLVLFGILYFWQFPHAMAIAWLYRHDFAAAKLQVATVVDPTGRTAARLAVLGALALLPVSLLPTLRHQWGWGYGGWMAAFGLVYLAASVDFLWRTEDRTARRLLRLSFAYLPLVLLVTLCAALG